VRRRELLTAAALAWTHPAVSANRTDLTADAVAWRIVNDGVMGGVSSSAVSRSGAALRFSGLISPANSGGFASMRRPFDAAAWEADAAGLALQVRGDGNRYRLRLYTRDAATGGEQWFVYQAVFETRAGEVAQAQLRWPQFAASFRGRTVADAPPIRFADVIAIGVMITKADHHEGSGPFALELLRIEPLQR
jgi:NADH dehydrogenase [ubiquinone] 1 alpha subcomplex assembly factor 1